MSHLVVVDVKHSRNPQAVELELFVKILICSVSYEGAVYLERQRRR